jgi:hypothetical protein
MEKIYLVDNAGLVLTEINVVKETKNCYHVLGGSEGFPHIYKESKSNWRLSFHKDFDSARKELIVHLNKKIEKLKKSIIDTELYIEALEKKTPQ